MQRRHSWVSALGFATVIACTGPDEAVETGPAGAAGDDTPADDDVGANDDDVPEPSFTGDDDTPELPRNPSPPMADDDDLVADDMDPAPVPIGDDDVPVADDDFAPPDDDIAPADDVPGDDDGVPVSDDDIATDDDAPVTPAPTGLGAVGATCATDGDCLSGLSCLGEDATYFGGVYPHGICTLPCLDDPFQCDAFSASCVGTTTEAWCVPPCQIGSTGIKCRADQSCVPTSTSNLDGFCDALCRDDMDCPEGLQCEPASGLCVDMPHEGAGVGEVCMANEECAGMLCLAAEAGAAQGLCTQFCNLTAELGRCGVSRDSTDPATGGCDVVTSREVSGMPLNVGDMGLCAATCEIDEGCPLPGWTCAELLEEAAEVVGHSGLCVFSYLLAAPDAGAP